MRLKFILYILLFTTISIYGQQMEKGFGMLENGKFAEAESFFGEILEDYPNNKTALICYGRAVGLNGKSNKACDLFQSMLVEYPSDLEVELNYAESLLWNANYEKAKIQYVDLVEQHPTNFAALLGLANTYSNLQEYPKALTYVEKALAVDSGNANAMVSKKYIRLGYAYKLGQKEQFDKAEELLIENLADFPNDKTILLNLANLYTNAKNTTKAVEAFQNLAANKQDSITALNGISLVMHLDKQEKLALSYAEESWNMTQTLEDSTLRDKAFERYVQALIWNRKFKEARSLIDDEMRKNTTTTALSLNAMLGMYTGDFKTSIGSYQQLLAKDSTSFDGNLGIANAYFASGNPDKAETAVKQTLEIFENQKDAMQFQKKLNLLTVPDLQEQISYSFDNGDNYSVASNTAVALPQNYKLSLYFAYQYRETRNSTTKNQATTHSVSSGIRYQLKPKVRLQGYVGTSFVNSFSQSYTPLNLHLSTHIIPFKLQNLELGYKRDIQTYNADLVDRRISNNHFYLNYNMGTNFKLGWFTQYYFTLQSDQNQRNLLFTSLYYNFKLQPVIKAGLNYQHIRFKFEVPEQYFSPESFHATEVFVDILKDLNGLVKPGWYYGITMAAGYQFINDEPKQAIYRVQTKAGYKASDRFNINVYGLHSNIASSTAAGYNYTELGIQLKWLLRKVD